MRVSRPFHSVIHSTHRSRTYARDIPLPGRSIGAGSDKTNGEPNINHERGWSAAILHHSNTPQPARAPQAKSDIPDYAYSRRVRVVHRIIRILITTRGACPLPSAATQDGGSGGPLLVYSCRLIYTGREHEWKLTSQRARCSRVS